MLQRARSILRKLVTPALVVLVFGSTGLLVYISAVTQPSAGGWIGWTRPVALPAAIFLLLCFVAARHEVRWARTARRLCKTLPQVRVGELPIDKLSPLTKNGDIGRLVVEIQDLLRDLRRQKLEILKLNEEMRQRVANRTDALERTIGSLRHQATRDALTGLGNRRMLDLCLPQLVETCRGQKTELCLLMIDVDNFKKLNDTLGHPCGDQFLRDIGGLVRSTVRETDLAFRMGGDEFVILMPDADLQAAKSLAVRLISLVDSHAKILKVDPRPRLSIGFSRLTAMPDATGAELMHAADQMLYAAKGSRKSDKSPAQSDAVRFG